MKVFISQSQKRSRRIAEELKLFVRKLVPATDPWIATTGIEKGTRWSVELANNLQEAGAGIICLTPENRDDRWILFEAGALSREPSDRVWTVLLDLAYEQVEKPLSDFQHTIVTVKDDVWKMIESINKTIGAAGELPRNGDDLREQFDDLWPKLETKLNEIRKIEVDIAAPPARDAKAILAEVLDVVRSLDRRSELALWRSDKTLRLLQEAYAQAFGREAPTMAGLRAAVEGRTTLLGALYSDTPLALRATAAEAVKVSDVVTAKMEDVNPRKAE
jgi:hypothetical protein